MITPQISKHKLRNYKLRSYSDFNLQTKRTLWHQHKFLTKQAWGPGFWSGKYILGFSKRLTYTVVKGS